MTPATNTQVKREREKKKPVPRAPECVWRRSVGSQQVYLAIPRYFRWIGGQAITSWVKPLENTQNLSAGSKASRNDDQLFHGRSRLEYWSVCVLAFFQPGKKIGGGVGRRLFKYLRISKEYKRSKLNAFLFSRRIKKRNVGACGQTNTSVCHPQHGKGKCVEEVYTGGGSQFYWQSEPKVKTISIRIFQVLMSSHRQIMFEEVNEKKMILKSKQARACQQASSCRHTGENAHVRQE